MEAFYKVLNRWYLVPSRLAKFIPSYLAHCFHSCSEQGTHMHIWWTCPIVQTFWEDIFALTAKLFDVPVQPVPTSALLNLKPDPLSHTLYKLFIQLLTAVK